MRRDPLTDIVGALELTGGVFLEAEFTAPWAITAHVTEEDCRPFMSVPNQVIAYHLVAEGAALVSIDDGRDVWAKAGDVVILPSNRRHVLASAKAVPPVVGDDLLLPAGENGLVRIRHGGGGTPARIFCGFLAGNGTPSPWIESLPDVLTVSLDDVAKLRWIEASISMAAEELKAGRLASGGIMSRLSELLLIESMRAHLERSTAAEGWLAGMADPRIARVLVEIHGRLDDPPAASELAGIAGMSRSAFVDRFSDVLGTSPRRYILGQQIRSAQLMLRETSFGLAEIAHRIGYEAPEAFSRAFKRETGQTPGEYREASTA